MPSGAPGDQPAGPADPADPARTADPAGPRTIGNYEIVSELGRGGMGVVYKAWRPDLGSFFAIKVLLVNEATSDDGWRRFEREAQATARLRHPGIVAVSDLGHEAGRPWFAMEYVEGIGLDRVVADPQRAGLARVDAPPAGGVPAPGLRPLDAARIAQQVAEAIDHAHRHGVLHRDLKPANVLLDRDGRARVVDFGLAKVLDPDGTQAGSWRTRSSVVMGTLAYMSPEQAGGAGGVVDARSDVYSLGALLFELVVGAPPFSGASHAELFMKALLVEPPRPRALRPGVPRDLETIILKALAKEKDRRYASAQELAEDLARFRRGEPVQARRAGPAERAWRWAARRRAGVAAGGLLLALAAVAAFLAGRARLAEQESSDLRSRRLHDLRTTAALCVDAALTLRRSGVCVSQAEQEYLPRLRRAVEEAEREAPDLAEPRYHLGRMYRALMRFDPALAEQDLALAKDPAWAPSLYERTILRLRAYGVRVTELRAEWLRAEGRRRAASGPLKDGGAAAGAALPERPPDEALAQADPQAATLRKGIQADLDALGKAGRAAAPGAAPGPAPARGAPGLAPAALACLQGLRLLETSTRPEDREEAGRRLEEALAGEPGLEEAYEGLARLALARGRADDAVTAYSRGLAVDRGYLPFLLARAAVRYDLGAAQVRRGEDGTGHFRAAADDYVRALEIDPHSAASLRGRGQLYIDWATSRILRGQDAADLLAAAEADLGQALELEPGDAEGWHRRAALRLLVGTGRMQRGEDPAADFGRADADFSRALELDARRPETWSRRGMLRTNLGVEQQRRGEDAGRLYGQAEADFGHALELDPGLAEAWCQRGLVRTYRGNQSVGRGEDPGPAYAAASADFDRALALDAGAADIWLGRGAAHENWGTWRGGRGEDPGPEYAGAEADYGHALERNPALEQAWQSRGNLRMNWGYFKKVHGGDPVELYALAVADFGKALELNPASIESWMRRGVVRMNWGVWRSGRGEDPGAQYEPALADFGSALKLNANFADAWLWRGNTRFAAALWAQGRAAGGGSSGGSGSGAAGALFAAALEDLGRAIVLNPRSAVAHAQRGQVFSTLGRWAEAEADYEAAARLNPASAADFRTLLEDARRHLGGPAPGAGEPAWWASLRAGERAIGAGDYAAAGRAYDAGLGDLERALAAAPEAERARLLADPGLGRLRMNAHYNRACIAALASAGRAGPGAAAQAVGAAAAATLRDRAFADLGRAFDLGYADAAHLAADEDLVPLRPDPRWAGVLRRAGGGGAR